MSIGMTARRVSGVSTRGRGNPRRLMNYYLAAKVGPRAVKLSIRLGTVNPRFDGE